MQDRKYHHAFIQQPEINRFVHRKCIIFIGVAINFNNLPLVEIILVLLSSLQRRPMRFIFQTELTGKYFLVNIKYLLSFFIGNIFPFEFT